MPLGNGDTRLKVAIIGGGPGGLACAIELGRLEFVDWDLYEKKTQISETGGGLTLQPQTWELLENNGAGKHIKESDFYRSADGLIEQRRHGRSGKLLTKKYYPNGIPLARQNGRMARAKLQSALLKTVKKGHAIHTNMRLTGISRLPHQKVRVEFNNGFVDEVDLLIAADGIRSCVYRTIVKKAKAKQIEGIPWAPVFWKHTSGLGVYTCPLGDGDFEVTARIRRPCKGKSPVSWGHSFDLGSILHDFSDFCLPVRQILRLAAAGETQEFALFSQPRMDRIISHDSIAFIGDASHAMQGNFGSGAGFALEDAFALRKVLQWTWSARKVVS